MTTKEIPMRKTFAILVGAAALAVPTANAVAAARTATAAPKKKVVVKAKSVVGPAVQASRWGTVQVTLTVRTTTTTTGKKKAVAVKITNATATFPHHTDRSVFINQQAGPLLIQETLTAQSANVQLISRATDSSNAFVQSLAAAVQQARA
jgi:uncharacterized protein with FMN-binding domain